MFSMLSGFPHGTFGPKTLHTHTHSRFPKPGQFNFLDEWKADYRKAVSA